MTCLLDTSVFWSIEVVVLYTLHWYLTMQLQSCHAQAFFVRNTGIFCQECKFLRRRRQRIGEKCKAVNVTTSLGIKIFNFLYTVFTIQEQCGNETRIFSRITHWKGTKSYVLQLMWNWKLCFSMN